MKRSEKKTSKKNQKNHNGKMPRHISICGHRNYDTSFYYYTEVLSEFAEKRLKK